MGKELMETIEEFKNRVRLHDERLRAWIATQTDKGEKEEKTGGIAVSGTLVWRNGKILKPTWVNKDLEPHYRICGKAVSIKVIKKKETIRVFKDTVKVVYLEYATNNIVWSGEEETRTRRPRVVEHENKLYLRVEV